MKTSFHIFASWGYNVILYITIVSLNRATCNYTIMGLVIIPSIVPILYWLVLTIERSTTIIMFLCFFYFQYRQQQSVMYAVLFLCVIFIIMFYTKKVKHTIHNPTYHRLVMGGGDGGGSYSLYGISNPTATA